MSTYARLFLGLAFSSALLLAAPAAATEPPPAPGSAQQAGTQGALPGGAVVTTGSGVTISEPDPGSTTIIRQPGTPGSTPVVADQGPTSIAAAPPAADPAAPAAPPLVTDNRPVCDDEGVNGQECTTVNAACPAGQTLLQTWSGPTEGEETPVGAPFCSGASPATSQPAAPAPTPSEAPPTVEELVTAGKQHAQHLDYPAPAPSLTPGPTTLVNLPTILQAGANQVPITATVTIHKVACAVSAVPHFVWSLPDADLDSITTDDSGRAFDGTVPADHPGYYVTAVWSTRGTRTVSLSVTWSATMTCDHIATVFDLGSDVEHFSGTSTVDVKEARSVLTGNS